jgi:hypothetical protein
VAAAQSSDRRSRVTRSPNSKSPAAIGRNHSSGLRGVETPHRGEIDRQEDDDEAADAVYERAAEEHPEWARQPPKSGTSLPSLSSALAVAGTFRAPSAGAIQARIVSLTTASVTLRPVSCARRPSATCLSASPRPWSRDSRRSLPVRSTAPRASPERWPPPPRRTCGSACLIAGST